MRPRRKGPKTLMVNRRRLRLRTGDRILLTRMGIGGLQAIGGVDTEIVALGEYEVQLVIVDDASEDPLPHWN
jgi:hypothetical protein